MTIHANEDGILFQAPCEFKALLQGYESLLSDVYYKRASPPPNKGKGKKTEGKEREAQRKAE